MSTTGSFVPTFAASRARLRAPRPGRGRPPRRGSASRSRASGDEGLRLPQGTRGRRGAPRSPTAWITAEARGARTLRARVLGRRDLEIATPARRTPRRTRYGSDRLVHRQSQRVQHAGGAGDRRVRRTARQQAHLLVGHPGLRQQVRGQRGGVRLEHDPPDPGPRAHRLRAGVRREPARVARQLHLDRRPGACAARRAQARREGLLREPARDRVGRAGRDDPDPARHRPLLHGGAPVRARSPATPSTSRRCARAARTSASCARSSRAIPPSAPRR